MEAERLADLLARTPLADGLEPEDVRLLAEQGELRRVARGELLIEEGVRGSALLVVVDGEVEVLKDSGDGGADLLQLVTLGQGTLLGEIGLILGEPASATVRTTRPSEIFVLHRDRFRELVDRQGGAAASLTLALTKILATRLRRMNEKIVEICDEYGEALAGTGGARPSLRGAELARFREQLLAEWNF